jgi:lipopolysaccharide export system protein LptA
VKKSLLIFLISLCPVLLFAQQTITVVSNIKVNFNEKRGTYRWYKPVFSHEGSTLAADSADYNQGDNFFDAYGNVVITQPNGTVVYADKLHYTEDTQEALLTNNVRLINEKAILTTNHLTYNMRSKIGTYINNGQIISGPDTLNSKTGYYFENTQDAYFRNNVVVKTPDVIIHTDTMRYNSGSKMTYFYGPTTIDGKNGRLYTENGDYNTETDQAAFGKNNLYTEGSKFLWGDSLIYDGKSGNGRAVKNVNFVDTAQHIVMRGQLGTYTKATQTTMVTENAYVVLTTKSDSTEQANPQDTISPSDAMVLKDTTEAEIDTINHPLDSIAKPAPSKSDSTYMSADTLFSQVIKLRDYKFANLKMSRDGGELEEVGDEEDTGENPVNNQSIDSLQEGTDDTLQITDSLALKDSLKIKELIPIDSFDKKLDAIDSLKKALPDTIDIDSLKEENLKALQVPDSLKKEIDSLKTQIKTQLPVIIDTNENLLDTTLNIPQKGDVES